MNALIGVVELALDCLGAGEKRRSFIHGCGSRKMLLLRYLLMKVDRRPRAEVQPHRTDLLDAVSSAVGHLSWPIANLMPKSQRPRSILVHSLRRLCPSARSVYSGQRRKTCPQWLRRSACMFALPRGTTHLDRMRRSTPPSHSDCKYSSHCTRLAIGTNQSQY